jgi:RNA polymerase sigma-70 factor, ECF subfamily
LHLSPCTGHPTEWMHHICVTAGVRRRQRANARNDESSCPPASYNSHGDGLTTIDEAGLEQLLQRCAARDAAALHALYQRMAPQLLAVLTSMLRTRAAAEDALQDVFIRIWNQAGQFEQIKGRPTSWMVAIARYRAIDLLRGSRVTVQLEQAELAGAEQLQVENPTDRMEFSSASTALGRCLRLLGAPQRQCLVLAYANGLSQERIAQSVGQPLGTVKSWMRRGLQALRACMET